jgi:hypothetical protein
MRATFADVWHNSVSAATADPRKYLHDPPLTAPAGTRTIVGSMK